VPRPPRGPSRFVGVHLPVRLYEALRARARRDDLSLSDIARQALRRMLDEAPRS
jgi:hypothetical protein